LGQEIANKHDAKKIYYIILAALHRSGIAMQYNHSMTDIVFAIRARVTFSQKPAIKTSNPELLGDLAEIYHDTLDLTLRAQIEQLMTLAGATWLALLHTPPRANPVIQLHKISPVCTTHPLVSAEAVA
jgi:hypothetical protein